MEVFRDKVDFPLYRLVASLVLLQLVINLLKLLLFVIQVGAGLRHLLEQLHLMVLLNPVQLAVFV